MSHVLIVGGGPSGAVLGLLLARAGMRPLIIDRATFPRAKPCAEYLSPGVLCQLGRLGLREQVEALAHGRLCGFELYAGDAMMRGTFGTARGWGDAPTYGIGVPRLELDAILLAAARDAGAHVREGVRAEEILRDGSRVSGIRARSADGLEEIGASLVAGADGVRGVVGRRLGMTAPRLAMRRASLVAHLQGIAGLGEYGEMHVIEGAYCGVAPLGNGLANVAMVLRPRAGAGIGRDPEAFFREHLNRFPHLGRRARQAQMAGPLLRTGPLSLHASRLVNDGVMLVGDAGGFYDPFTGQGIYKALRSAQLAAPVILRAMRAGDTSRAALVPYERARLREFRGSSAVERLVQRFAGRPRLLAHAVARLGRRTPMAATMVGVTGDVLPARRVLNPWFLARLGI